MHRFYLVFIVINIVFVDASFARTRGIDRDENEISAIVLHSVGGPACIAKKVQFRKIPQRADDAKFWRSIMARSTRADAHFIIGRDGDVEDLIATSQIAYHTIAINSVSIGIELVNRGDGLEAFPEPQIIAVIELVLKLREQYPTILIENIITHGDVDRRTCKCGGKIYNRRVDPGAAFPMSRIRKEVARLGEDLEKLSSLSFVSGPAKGRACVNLRR